MTSPRLDMARLASTVALIALVHAAAARKIQFSGGANVSLRIYSTQCSIDLSCMQCLGVRSPANDAPTVIVSCSDASAKSDWTYTAPGDNASIQLTGTNLCAIICSVVCMHADCRSRRCLDAGTNPHNNGPAKVYTCYPGLAAQHWYFTADDRIALTGGDQCLDLNDSTGAPQTYQCTTGNTNQVWTPGSTPTTTTSTANITPAPTPTPTVVQYIHPGNVDQTRCLSYAGVYDGASVEVGTCGAASEFFVAHGDNVGIYVPGTNLCVQRAPLASAELMRTPGASRRSTAATWATGSSSRTAG
jgi:hypothetical protein